jgi:hypothetical protein
MRLAEFPSPPAGASLSRLFGPATNPMKNAARTPAKRAGAPAPFLWRYTHDPALGVWVAACDSLKLTVQASSYPALLGCLGEAMVAVMSDRPDPLPDGDYPVTTLRVPAEEQMRPPRRGFVAGNR